MTYFIYEKRAGETVYQEVLYRQQGPGQVEVAFRNHGRDWILSYGQLGSLYADGEVWFAPERTREISEAEYLMILFSTLPAETQYHGVLSDFRISKGAAGWPIP